MALTVKWKNIETLACLGCYTKQPDNTVDHSHFALLMRPRWSGLLNDVMRRIKSCARTWHIGCCLSVGSQDWQYSLSIQSSFYQVYGTWQVWKFCSHTCHNWQRQSDTAIHKLQQPFYRSSTCIIYNILFAAHPAVMYDIDNGTNGICKERALFRI
jgi:hypothetical protein